MTCQKCKKDIPDDAALCCYCGKSQTKKKRRPRRANNTGSVYKLSGSESRDRPWGAEKGGIFLGTFKTKREGEEYLNSILHLNVNARFDYTVEDIYEAWKLEREGSPTFSGSWTHIPEKIRKSKMRKLVATDLQGIIDAMTEKDLSRATCDKVKQLLNFLSRWALREDIIQKNYAEFIRLPKDETESAKPFTDEDIVKLQQHDEDPDVKAILILIYTGWRISEFLHLKRASINIKDGYMIGGSKTPSGKNRVVPICQAISKYILWFLDNPHPGCSGPDRPFLQNIAGRPYDRNGWSSKHFHPALRRCGITEHYTPHSTRHTFATIAARSKMPREDLQKIIGHKKYETTANVYIHANLPAVQAAGQNLDTLIFSNKLLTDDVSTEQEKAP